MMLASAFAAMVLGQLREVPDLALATKLRAGEHVRYFKRGGRTRFGQYLVLVAVTEKRAYIKTNEYADTRTLDDTDRLQLREALADADLKSLFLTKRTEDYPPSAVDATDVFLTTRSTTWDNLRYDAPAPLPKLLELLDTWVEAARPRGS
jgi:hypothetical protein